MNPMDLKSGWVDVSEREGIISPSYYVLVKRDNSVNPKYFSYQFQRMYREKILFPFGQGVSYDYRWGLNKETLLNFPIVLPPKNIQDSIVKVLDKVLSEIDELIDRTKQKIQLLHQKRKSLIFQVVFKGLNPSVETEVSINPWTETVPSHWIKTPNKKILKLKKTIVGSESNQYEVLGLGKSGVTVKDVESGKGKLPKSFDVYQIVRRGEFIFCLFDVDETPRTVGLSEYDGITSPDYRVFECSDEVNRRFIYYTYLSIDEIKGLRPYYTGLRKRVRPKTLLSLFTYLPPRDEQDSIVEFLDTQKNRIESMIQLEENRIRLLSEFRQSLISTIITGTIEIE